MLYMQFVHEELMNYLPVNVSANPPSISGSLYGLGPPVYECLQLLVDILQLRVATATPLLSSGSSHPSQNLLTHSKTCVHGTTSFPLTVSIILFLQLFIQV
jgi:hypothetical protein